jgi:hypothetical protein
VLEVSFLLLLQGQGCQALCGSDLEPGNCVEKVTIGWVHARCPGPKRDTGVPTPAFWFRYGEAEAKAKAYAAAAAPATPYPVPGSGNTTTFPEGSTVVVIGNQVHNAAPQQQPPSPEEQPQGVVQEPFVILSESYGPRGVYVSDQRPRVLAQQRGHVWPPPISDRASIQSCSSVDEAVETYFLHNPRCSQVTLWR